MVVRRRRKNPDSFKIIYQSEEYGGMPSDKPTPKGWTVLRDGFSSKKEAQQFLHDEIDKIPEGFGLPTAQSLKDDEIIRKLRRGNPIRRRRVKRTLVEWFMLRRGVNQLRTEYPFHVVHPSMGMVWIHNEKDLIAYLKRARADKMARCRNPRGSDSSDYSSYLNDDLPKVRGKYKDRYTEPSLSDCYSRGRAAYNMGHSRTPHSSYSPKQKEAMLAGYDDAKNKNTRKNPLPKSAPSRALLCVGQLRDLEIYDPKTESTKHIKPHNKWLAWDGKQFHVCNVSGQANADLPKEVQKRHRKFHQANPQGKPFVGSMPDRSASVRDVGLLKSLVYYVPTKIRSPGKNKYLWHHAFGDTGHKGGDSYPIKVMPMLQKDSAGNLFIKRRPGNIFKVDQWLRG